MPGDDDEDTGMAAGRTSSRLGPTEIFADPRPIAGEAERRLAAWDMRAEPPPAPPGREVEHDAMIETCGGWGRMLAVHDELRRLKDTGELPPPTPAQQAESRKTAAVLVRAGRRVQTRRRLYERRTRASLIVPVPLGRRPAGRSRERHQRPRRRSTRRCASRSSPGDHSDNPAPGEARHRDRRRAPR